MHTEPRLRLAAIGCGRVFERYHLPAVLASTDWSLAAVCDSDIGRLEWAANHISDAVRVDSATALVDRDDLDAVLISTPPETHAPLAIAAMEQGKHVLVEKPMAVSVAEADEMIRVSRATGRCLAVGFNRRFRTTYDKARNLLGAVELDSLRAIRHDFIADALRWSSIHEELDRTGRLVYLLHDVASHQVDLVPWLLDRRLESVRVIGSAIDSSATMLEFEMKLVGGIVSRCRSGHGSRYEERLSVHLPRGGFVAFPAGIVGFRRQPNVWTRLRGDTLMVCNLAVSRITRGPNMTLQSFQLQLAALARRIRGTDRSDLGADVVSGREAVAALEACRLSVEREGSWQAVDASHLEEKN